MTQPEEPKIDYTQLHEMMTRNSFVLATASQPSMQFKRG